MPMRFSWLYIPPSLPVWQWAETFALTGLVFGLSWLSQPHDPLCIRAVFPWVWFAPVLLALRYGLLAGLGSCLLLLGGWRWGAAWGGWETSVFPKEYVLGGIILSFLCGEYGDWWKTRLRRAEDQQHYLDERISQLTETLYVLRLSHDRLEQNMISQPVSLREALSRLRDLVIPHGEVLSAEMANHLLLLMGQYFQLEVAGIYRQEQTNHPPTVLARLGQPGPFDLSDPLVGFSQEHNTLCHFLVQETDQAATSRYLVVAPLITSAGKQLGWFAVEKMPFLALHEETLQMMLAFLSYFADSTYAVHTAHTVLAAYPDCPAAFAQELLKLFRLRRESDIESHAVCWILHSHPLQREFLTTLKASFRAVDVTWETCQADAVRLVTLMPFTTAPAVQGYLDRMHSQELQGKFGLSYQEAGISVYYAALDHREAVTWLNDFLPHCRVSPPVVQQAGQATIDTEYLSGPAEASAEEPAPFLLNQDSQALEARTY